jgi:protein involved in polysaccharide export with SLBB domain
MRRLLVCTALALAACGPAAVHTPPDEPTPTVITVAMDGQAVHVHTGDTLEVRLAQQPGFTQWSAVNTSNARVLEPVVGTRAIAVRGMTLAAYRAMASGAAELTATAGLDCSPGAACAQLVRLFRVTVIVG